MYEYGKYLMMISPYNLIMLALWMNLIFDMKCSFIYLNALNMPDLISSIKEIDLHMCR